MLSLRTTKLYNGDISIA